MSLRTPYPDLEWVDGEVDNKFEFVQIKDASITKYGSFKVTSNAVSFGKAFKFGNGSGTIVKYRKAGASSWSEKKFKGGSTIKLTGLKPSTTYEIQGANYVTAKGKVSVGAYTKTIKVNTASNAPAINSIKASNVKEYQVTICNKLNCVLS